MTANDSRASRWAAAYAERPRLLRIARRRTASVAEAEDCVSEAVLRCVEFESLDEERIPAFLTTVTLRLCADQHRGRARLARVGGQLLGTTEEPSPEDSVCDQAEAQWLVERLRGMSAHQRRVVAARAEGLSCEDVAGRLDVSVDAVKSAVARVRSTARAALAKTLGLIPVAFRRSGYEVATAGGGALASAIAGVAIGGLVLLPPAPAEPQRIEAVPPAPGHGFAAVRIEPEPRAVLTRPARVAATVTRSAGGDVFVIVGDHYDPTRDKAPDRGKPKNELESGPWGVSGDEGDESLEDQIQECLKYGVQLGRGDIRCNDPGEGP